MLKKDLNANVAPLNVSQTFTHIGVRRDLRDN